ncbi:hypothetical protein BDM02DRAFT_3123977, partial [Thelephora ganbajun]
MSSRKRRLTESGGTSGSNSDQSQSQRSRESRTSHRFSSTSRKNPLIGSLPSSLHLAGSPPLSSIMSNLKTSRILNPSWTGSGKTSQRSALKEIEGRAQELLARGMAAQFLDKDSGEVARLVERLREAITHYQVSGKCFVATNRTDIGGQILQQQAIYDKIVNLSSSLDALLELHKVTHFNKLVTMFADTWIEITGGEKQVGLRDGAVGSAVLRGG